MYREPTMESYGTELFPGAPERILKSKRSYEILSLLSVKPRTVTELEEDVPVAESTLREYIAALKNYGMVDKGDEKRNGKSAYHINYDGIYQAWQEYWGMPYPPEDPHRFLDLLAGIIDDDELAEIEEHLPEALEEYFKTYLNPSEPVNILDLAEEGGLPSDPIMASTATLNDMLGNDFMTVISGVAQRRYNKDLPDWMELFIQEFAVLHMRNSVYYAKKGDIHGKLHRGEVTVDEIFGLKED